MEDCEMIEQLDSAHKSHQMHNQIRKVTGRENNTGVTTCIEQSVGNIIMEQKKILSRWHEYISKLYDGVRGGMIQINTDIELYTITHTEIEFALNGMPMMKAPVPDDISPEMIVSAGEEGVTDLQTYQT